jgi:hypothetical protein
VHSPSRHRPEQENEVEPMPARELGDARADGRVRGEREERVR